MAEGEHNDMSIGTAENPLLVGGITFQIDGEGLTFTLCAHDGRQKGDLVSFEEYLEKMGKIETRTNSLDKEKIKSQEASKLLKEIDEIKKIKEKQAIEEAKTALINYLQVTVGLSLNEGSNGLKILDPPRKHSKTLEQLLRKDFSDLDQEYRGYWAYELDENAAIKLVFKESESNENADEIDHHFWFRCPIQLQENQSYWIKLEGNEAKERFQFALSEAGTPRGYLTPSPSKELLWNLNYGENLLAGQILVKEKKNNGDLGEIVFKLPIVVVPRKIELKELEQIFADVMNEHVQLLFTYKGPTGIPLKTEKLGKKNPLQKLKFIEWFFKRESHRLDRILFSIISNPDKKLVTEQVWEDIAFATSPSMDGLYEMLTRPEIMVKVGSSTGPELPSASVVHFRHRDQDYRFTQVLEERSRISYDTYPNRFVKFFLKYMISQLNEVEALLQTGIEDETTYDYWYQQALKRERTIRNYLNTDFFQEVSDIHGIMGSSQVLQNEPRYREVFKAYLDLVRGLTFSFDELEEMLNDPVKSMHELYEYWCFFKLRNILRNVIRGSETGDIRIKRDEKVGEQLVENIWTKFQNNDLTATLFYNLETSGEVEIDGQKGKSLSTYSVPFRPDLVLVLEKGKKKRLVVFDAKYRVEWEKVWEESKEEIIREEKRGKFKRADLYKMHTYRDALAWEGRGQKPLLVVALFPGTKGRFYTEKGKEIKVEEKDGDSTWLEELKKSVQEPKGGVGALPLRPSEPKGSEEKGPKGKWVKEFLESLTDI